MLKARLIPCLDVKNGRVVKGVSFVDLRDAGDPVETAIAYNQAGADELCFLDITASHENRNAIIDVVKEVAEKCFIPLTVGGGVRTIGDIRNLLNAGADKVSVNTSAIQNPQFVRDAAQKFGSQCITVALDARRIEGEKKWQLFTHGGRKPTGFNALDFARKMTKFGAGEILLTSMDQDGQKNGFDIELTRAISDGVTIPVIASGGAGHPKHLADAILKGHASAVLAASIFHFGEYSIKETKIYMQNAGVPVRMH